MLQVIADALLARSGRTIEECCGYYQNRKGDWGRFMTVWHAGHYHMISVSHIEDVPTSRDVARALVSPLAQICESDNYVNRHGTLGWWATVKSGGHWYMLSVSDTYEPYRHHRWDNFAALQGSAVAKSRCNSRANYFSNSFVNLSPKSVSNTMDPTCVALVADASHMQAICTAHACPLR